MKSATSAADTTQHRYNALGQKEARLLGAAYFVYDGWQDRGPSGTLGESVGSSVSR
jgi:hypothetical protein